MHANQAFHQLALQHCAYLVCFYFEWRERNHSFIVHLETSGCSNLSLKLGYFYCYLKQFLILNIC